MAKTNPDPKEWSLTLDAQTVWVPKNNVSIPNNATRFDFRELTGTGSKGAWRSELIYRPKNRATEWRLMIAPLQVSGVGRLSQNVNFDGATFNTLSDTAGTYKFNSYRVTWRRYVNENWAVGVTLKIRDAKVSLQQGATSRSYSNVGLVPLLNISGKTPLGKNLSMLTDFDGAWSIQGRAWDLGLSLAYDFNPDMQLRIGARYLEGGADVPKVYNFTQLNYLTFGSSIKF